MAQLQVMAAQAVVRAQQVPMVLLGNEDQVAARVVQQASTL
jgi:hypothetical protein